jgi:hypothetical protein
MSCDKLVFDLSQEVEGSPSVFIKKDWISILDNQNGSYASNQCVIDTSQLSNSNKYMSYREAYLQVPMVLTLSSTATALATTFAPATATSSADYAIGLKNWFGSVIHSLTLDYNGTTIIQQTPFINMWNSFKLMTTLSWADVATIGPTIGFYPDDPLTWGFFATATESGSGCCNNFVGTTSLIATQTTGKDSCFAAGTTNTGLLRRIQYINFDPAGIPATGGTGTYASFLTSTQLDSLYKSYVFRKVTSAASAGGVLQIAISASIYLKHLHSFFQQVPLLKGVFMKMTLSLNNSTATFTRSAAAAGTMTLLTSTNAVGGICPFMVSSTLSNSGGNNIGTTAATMWANLSVGATCLDSALKTANAVPGSFAATNFPNVTLNVPAYTFNPTFESAYLSSPVKSIKYTDVYQYQIVNTIGVGGTFNNLITNGIAGLKSILVLPFFTAGTSSTQSGVDGAVSPYMSPFDPAGAGPTSPLCLLTNFNVVVSGQNMLYNTERYSYEQFNQQLLGVNAVNGGLTDGLTSSLISAQGFEMEYCYYYVDVSRMLPVEETVPKSVQIIGQNQSRKAIDLIVFCEYGCSVDIDILTGARV